MFKFENVFLKFYTNQRGSAMLRMVDYDLLSIHLENTKVLNIVDFLIHRKEKVINVNIEDSPGTMQSIDKVTTEHFKNFSGVKEHKNIQHFSQSIVPTILTWDDIAPYLKGIGKRTWFLHILEPQIRKLELKLLMRRGISSSSISEGRINNVIVSYYEGMIRDYFNSAIDDEETNLAFGRSIYCNYEKTYYFGYTLGQEKH